MKRKQEGRHVRSVDKAPLGPNLEFLSREAYNAIRTNLMLSMHKKDKAGRVVGITSPSPKDGKSYTAINLSYALAKNGSRVLLINGDLRLPSTELYIGITHQKGLSNYLCGDMEPDEGIPIVDHVMDVDFSVLAAGTVPPNPSELLGSSEMEELLQKFRQDYDYVIIDLPPISSVIDAIAISPYLDGMILVTRQGATHKRDIRESMSKLKFSGVHILGFVMNDYSAAGAKHKYKYYK